MRRIGQDLTRNDLDFSAPENQLAKRILLFLNKNIPVFLRSFEVAKLSPIEDEISKDIALFFAQSLLSEDLLLHCSAKKGADLEFHISPYKQGSKPVFLLEAKRLPPTNNKDYVKGTTGGIERFKRELEGFGQHLTIAGILGYVQKNNFDHWFNQINKWIDEQMEDDKDLIWADEDKLRVEENISDFISSHRRASGSNITLHHFWLNLI